MRFFIPILLAWATPVLAQELAIPCPQIEIRGEQQLELNENERRLVCGGPGDAYANIPLYQARYLLQGFLQSRGHLNPTFEVKNNVLKVELGPSIRLKNWQVLSSSQPLNLALEEQIARFYANQVMTPKLLDEIERFADTFIKNRGLGCAELKSEFHVSTQTLELKLVGTDPLTFGQVTLTPVEGLAPSALSRFQPFSPGRPFDARLLDLNSLRLSRAGVVQGNYFERRCDSEHQLKLTHHFIPGPARVIRFGVGVNTEVGPLARIRWAHQRFGPMASRLEASAQLSAREQLFQASANLYLWEKSPRHFLSTTLELDREDYTTYEEVRIKLAPHLATTIETTQTQWQLSAGPSLISNRYKTDQTNDQRTQNSGVLEFKVLNRSHDYELNDLHPQSGHELLFTGELRHPSLGFDELITQWVGGLTQLFPVTEWGRGELVLGHRTTLATTIVDSLLGLENLPPSLKFYGGGSGDIRGHKLRSLPINQGLGALTKASIRLEARRTAFFHATLEAFVFMDLARFGERSLNLTSETAASPGLGLRWLSPIGLIQAYAAETRWYSPDRNEGWTGFIGLGGSL